MSRREPLDPYYTRHDDIQRLNNRTTLQQAEDAEQMAALERCGSFNNTALGIIAIIALGLGCFILSRPPIPAYPDPPATHAFIFTCLTCHFPRPATEAKTYAEHRNKPRFKVPPVDLSELVRQ